MAKEIKRFSNRDDMVWDYSLIQQPTAEENIHSPVGASSAERWINCPGSNNLIAKLPKEVEVPKVYAAEGTVAHRLGETALRYLDFLVLGEDDIAFWLDGWVDTIVEQESFEITISEELADCVFVYVKTIRDIMLSHDAPYEYLSIERSFVMSEVGPEARGTTDAMIEIPYELLYIIDLKAGTGVPVEVKGNKQCMYYAVGGYLSTGQEVQEVEQVIIQPRCYHPHGPVRSERYAVSEVVGFMGALKIAIEKTRKPTAKLGSGDHCKWCKAKPICPEIEKAALKVAQSEFSAISEAVTLPTAEGLPIERMVAALNFEKLFTSWLDEIRSVLHSLADKGTDLKPYGLKLVQKKSNRAWADEKLASVELVNVLGSEKAFTSKLITPAQAEKAYKSERRDAKCIPETIKPDNGTTLASIDDTRPEVAKVLEAEFKVVEEGVNLDDM